MKGKAGMGLLQKARLQLDRHKEKRLRCTITDMLVVDLSLWMMDFHGILFSSLYSSVLSKVSIMAMYSPCNIYFKKERKRRRNEKERERKE